MEVPMGNKCRVSRRKRIKGGRSGFKEGEGALFRREVGGITNLKRQIIKFNLWAKMKSSNNGQKIQFFHTFSGTGGSASADRCDKPTANRDRLIAAREQQVCSTQPLRLRASRSAYRLRRAENSNSTPIDLRSTGVLFEFLLTRGVRKWKCHPVVLWKFH